MSDIAKLLEDQITKLSQEAEAIIAERDALISRAREIDTRLTQIAGGILVLNDTIKSIEKVGEKPFSEHTYQPEF